jgi:hypothetical protein
MTDCRCWLAIQIKPTWLGGIIVAWQGRVATSNNRYRLNFNENAGMCKV